MIAMTKTATRKMKKGLKPHGTSGFRHYGAIGDCIKDGMNIDIIVQNINQARMDGEAVGEHRGIQTGRSEGELSIMTAIRMIKENKPFSEIGEKTGLAEQRLTELKAML